MRLRSFNFESENRNFWSDCWLYDVDPSNYESLRDQAVSEKDWTKVAKTTDELTERGWTTADEAYKIARKCLLSDSNC